MPRSFNLSSLNKTRRAALYFGVGVFALPFAAQAEAAGTEEAGTEEAGTEEAQEPAPEAIRIAPQPVLSLASARESAAQQANAAGSSQTQGPPAGAPGAPPFAMQKPVFDDTWVSLGIGAGLVPSYQGSDDYIVFPLPLIVGRVGGVGIRPNGPGFVLDVFSPEPSFGQRKTRLSAGPAFRIRNDRVAQIEDEVVETLEDLDLAIEVGGNVGVSFPGVFNPRDTLTLQTQVRWDVAGAHEGMLVEPSIGYRRIFGTGVLLQMNAGLQFVDDSYAEYYFSVTPEQSAISGLPVFDAQGGLNSVGSTAILNFDLDGNALNGGFNIYTIVGYTRLLNDGADTPFTDLRGDANQFVGGIGVGYTF